MGQDIKMYRGTSEKIAEHPIEDGALYFSTSKIEGYMDYNGERLPLYQEQKNYWNSFPKAPPVAYFILEDINGNDFTWSMSHKFWSGVSTDGVLEYSLDHNTWVEYSDISKSIQSANGKLYLRGTGNIRLSSTASGNMNYSTMQFSPATARIKCSGNIEALLDWQTVANGEHPNMSSWAYSGLFYNCSSLVEISELPAIELSAYCYHSMFEGCINLLVGPVLPATKMAQDCYDSMYSGCTALVTASSLPATTLANNCYYYMYSGCTALTTLPILPATQLEIGCYGYMFQGCNKIKLSTTETDEYTQSYVVHGSSSIAEYCIPGMFDNTGGTFVGTPNVNTTYYVSNTNSIV